MGTGASPGAWLQVRNWLRSWAAVARVGRDYWVPADAIPAEPARTRLAVIRVHGGEPLPRDEGRREKGRPATVGTRARGQSQPN